MHFFISNPNFFAIIVDVSIPDVALKNGSVNKRNGPIITVMIVASTFLNAVTFAAIIFPPF
jgi:hypothetical protein